MREGRTFPTESEANRAARFLLAKGIQTQLRSGSGGWEVWIQEEDEVARGRQALEEYAQHPGSPEVKSAVQEGTSRQREETERRRQEQVEVIDVRRAMVWWRLRRTPLTILLVAASVLVALVTLFGARISPVLDHLTIASVRIEGEQVVWSGLSEIQHGQVWRLVTPILVHFGVIHLAFNVLALLYLGRLVEEHRGFWRFLGLVLVLAVASNLGQYLFSGPYFGGLSGVLYGLFGYSWMQSRYAPWGGIHLHPTAVWFLLGWFLICLAGWIGPVGNAAHAVGLGLGILLGYLQAAVSREP